MKDTWKSTYHLFEGSLEPVLMLHGFPGEKFNNTPIEKNYDIAKEINKRGHKVVLIHYGGLGNNTNKTFSFKSSILESFTIAEELLKNSASIRLFGHSWGGYVALAINSRLKDKISSSILLSPLFYLPEKGILLQLLENICKETPSLMKGNTNPHFLVDDLISTDHETFPKKEFILSLIQNLHIFHAKNDNEIPIESSLQLAKANPNIKLTICESDHTFQKNRREVFSKILEEHF